MEKIQFRAILEILGRPPEHIIQGLKLIIDRIKAEKGIVIIEEIHHAPALVKDSKDLYTTFSELTLEVDNLNILFGFIFQYMPSNIDIISPENLSLSNQDMNQATNHLAQRMHQYDAITKKMLAERDHVLKKLYEVAPHLFKQAPATVIKEKQENEEDKKSVKKSKSSKKSKKKK